MFVSTQHLWTSSGPRTAEAVDIFSTVSPGTHPAAVTDNPTLLGVPLAGNSNSSSTIPPGLSQVDNFTSFGNTVPPIREDLLLVTKPPLLPCWATITNSPSAGFTHKKSSMSTRTSVVMSECLFQPDPDEAWLFTVFSPSGWKMIAASPHYLDLYNTSRASMCI
jgi:hypothetical protein